MFFYEKIRNNRFNNKAAILIFNSLIIFCRLFIFKRKRSEIRIVIVALQRLGDTVFTIPAVKSIIDFHQNSVHIICYPETTPIFKLIFPKQEYVELKHEFFFINNQIAKPIARKILRGLDPTIIYDMTGNVTSASLLFNSSASEIIGINEKYYKSIYTKFNPLRREPHLIDNYLDGIRDLMPIYKSNDAKIITNFNQNRILIHPFASKRSKEWGLKKFIKLAESLNKEFECIMVTPPLSISTDVKEVLHIKQIPLIETKTIDELIELIKGSLMLIGNDSGAVHIANLLGKPTFTIYGPTNPEYHKPLNGVNEYIIKELPCSAKENEKICFTFGGVYCPSYECMVNLKYDEVEDRIKLFLKTNSNRKSK
ncbi:MAG: glycosyltransferase family 9 protein [Ignavibacteriota bacterium]|nr:glycosyltransferase family 9 protein [Ignavibacteriota bacterium]MCO6448171.1 glycosyltransferase family 9 protein [Ignavibacterium album]MCZ2267336.1 glycosyltransferase family 9 protein [Ignavibacteriales bacterium]QKJ99476.1 MAG: glycosyltransferase family 9 protein [Ignavibacteriota bacterium]HOJ06882.1 glycosyltransferase family 9 protein [Ignavibacteriaceae bacterium]